MPISAKLITDRAKQICFQNLRLLWKNVVRQKVGCSCYLTQTELMKKRIKITEISAVVLEECWLRAVRLWRRTKNEKSKYSTTHSLHLLVDWQHYKFVESFDQDSVCTLCLYRPSFLNIGDLVWCCHCQTDKEQKEIILISIIRHLLFVFTSIQTPFRRSLATQRTPSGVLFALAAALVASKLALRAKRRRIRFAFAARRSTSSLVRRRACESSRKARIP